MIERVRYVGQAALHRYASICWDEGDHHIRVRETYAFKGNMCFKILGVFEDTNYSKAQEQFPYLQRRYFTLEKETIVYHR